MNRRAKHERCVCVVCKLCPLRLPYGFRFVCLYLVCLAMHLPFCLLLRLALANINFRHRCQLCEKSVICLAYVYELSASCYSSASVFLPVPCLSHITVCLSISIFLLSVRPASTSVLVCVGFASLICLSLSVYLIVVCRFVGLCICLVCCQYLQSDKKTEL